MGERLPAVSCRSAPFVLAGSAIAAGAATLIPSRLGMRKQALSSRDYWQVVERHGVTLLSGGPNLRFSTLLQPSGRMGVVDISGIKRPCLAAGSPMPAGLASAFEERLRHPRPQHLRHDRGGRHDLGGAATCRASAGIVGLADSLQRDRRSLRPMARAVPTPIAPWSAVRTGCWPSAAQM